MRPDATLFLFIPCLFHAFSIRCLEVGVPVHCYLVLCYALLCLCLVMRGCTCVLFVFYARSVRSHVMSLHLRLFIESSSSLWRYLYAWWR